MYTIVETYLPMHMYLGFCFNQFLFMCLSSVWTETTIPTENEV